jgi:hypothetical protein
LPSFALTANQGDAVQQALRPYATAGVALVGAGLIAITPMAPRLPDTFTVQDIKLVAGEDTLPDLAAPWTDVFNTASENATTLLNNFYDAPFIGLQQAIANESGFLQEFFESPTSSSVTDAMGQMQDNLAAVLTGYGLQGASAETTATVLAHTLDSVGQAGGHTTLFSEIPGYLPASDAAEITPIINFLASPESGIIMGDLGPLISPLVELSNCITAGDDLNTTLADVTGAFFNGATLNLDSLLPTINGLDLFPAGMEMGNLDIGFGGLLSTGSVGTSTVLGDGEVGGSIFNSVGIYFSGVPGIGVLDAPSQAIGPIGALEEWGQTIATLIGWDGTGSPLAGIDLPIIPTDFLDSGTAAATAGADLSTAAADVSTWVQDLLAAF